MNESIPDNRNRLAYAIGLLFHPFLLCIPVLLVVLADRPLMEVVGWTALTAGGIVLPTAAVVTLLRRRGRAVYQRAPRSLIYPVTWAAVLLTGLFIRLLGGPERLQACMAALALWVPVQFAFNHWVTKLSTHTGVAAACMVGLGLMGRLNHPALLLLAAMIVLAVGWARVTTRNHTLTQVLLGGAVGAVCVVVGFSLFTP